MLRVRLTDIPRQGLSLDTKISVDALNTRIANGEECDTRATADPEVHVQIFLERDSAEVGALLTGDVKVALEQDCRRCLQPIASQLDVEINYVLKPAKAGNPEEQFEEDLGLALYEGDSIELEELLQEAIILAIDPLGSRHEDCELPEGLTIEIESAEAVTGSLFGDLLKEAKVRKK